MPPKRSKAGKGKDEEWNDEEAERRLAAVLTVKDDIDKEQFDDSEEETPRNRKNEKSKNRMTIADLMLENDSDSKEDEISDAETPPVRVEPKKGRKEKSKKKDKRKEKRDDDDLDELIASLDKKEEKVEKNPKKNEKRRDAEESFTSPSAADVESHELAEPVTDLEKGKKDENMTEEEKKKEEKKRKEKEKKKQKEKEKKEKEKEKKEGKKISHVDQIREQQRAIAEAAEAQAKKDAEEKERIDAFNRAQEENERIRKEEKEAERKRKQEKIEAEKRAGTYLTPSQRAKLLQAQARLAAANIVVRRDDVVAVDKPKKRVVNEVKKVKGAQSPAESTPATPTPVEQSVAVSDVSVSSSDEPVDDWELADEIPVPAPAAKASAAATADEADEATTQESSTVEKCNAASSRLRAPIVCVLGHVDTGKTKMLDTIRRTNVQDGEAGGITQQIGATQVPGDAIKERCKMVRDFDPEKMEIPGFLIIDTPGHESFSNLRNRGSSLCDFAILVVDIMHGLEPQTIESLKLLQKRETPFVVALNKIDRLYGYESNPHKDVYAHLKSQGTNTTLEFTQLYNRIVVQFAEQGVNVILSNKNKNETEYISMVPTSAFLGDGIGNLMAYIVQTTQTRFAEKLTFREELDATVMEVKMIPGLGTIIDVILVNGTLNVGDNIVLTGHDGAIVTPIRELLMPQPLKEMRVKNEYDRFKQIKGAQGIKILAKGLETALAGLPLFVARNGDEEAILREEAKAQLKNALTSIKKKTEGVYVQASTLGSLEALLEFLKAQKIPYSNVNIGPVHKNDVQKAAIMLERNPKFACILAFDVPVEKDAQKFADNEGVKIFRADIIYHLEDSFLQYREELRLKERAENEHRAIFPCKLRVLPQHIFNARNPIVIGVAIEAGLLKKGTPICVPSKEGILLGAVSSIERNNEPVDLAKSGEEVCIKIENTTGESPKLYGRHFTHEDALVSKITRDSIEACKEHFRSDLSAADWSLVVKLKPLLGII